MKSHIRFLKCENKFNAVFRYRTQQDSTAGTVWRFIMDNNRTLILTPCQTNTSPAPFAHCVPQRIESVLTGPFSWAIACVGRRANYRNWGDELEESTEKELAEWRNKNTAADRKAIEAARECIEEKLRIALDNEIKKFKREIFEENREILKQTLREFGLQRLGNNNLEELITFIQESFYGRRKFCPLTDSQLQRAIVKINDLFGKDITAAVILKSRSWINDYIEKWGLEIAETEGVSENDARERLLKRVRYIAYFDGIPYLIQHMTLCIHDECDGEMFKAVAPDDGEREEIEETVIRRENEENDQHEEYWDYMNETLTECRKAGPHMMLRGKYAANCGQSSDDSNLRQYLELHPEKKFYDMIHWTGDKASWPPAGKAARFDITDSDPSWKPRNFPSWVCPPKGIPPEKIRKQSR